jgi:hypothetical protein
MVIDVKVHLCLTQMMVQAMASLSELVATIAEAEAIDPATVSLVARYVREGGLIEKRGRGPSAAKMGATDAANLLIAVNATSSIRDAASAVRVYRDLIDLERTSAPPNSFGEALELLIEFAVENKLPSTFLSKEMPEEAREAFKKGAAVISIRFERPDPVVFLDIGPPRTTEMWAGIQTPTIGRSFRAAFFPKQNQGKRSSRKTKIGDRKDQTTIGNVTIFAVAEKLR